MRGSPSYDVVKYNVRALVPLTSPSPWNSVVTIDSYRAANASSINPLAKASRTPGASRECKQALIELDSAHLPP